MVQKLVAEVGFKRQLQMAGTEVEDRSWVQKLGADIAPEIAPLQFTWYPSYDPIWICVRLQFGNWDFNSIVFQDLDP